MQRRASDFAISGALSQIVENELQPLAFFLKNLTQTERAYNEYNRELLIAYAAVKHFRHILEEKCFTLFTDHKPLRMHKNSEQTNIHRANQDVTFYN